MRERIKTQVQQLVGMIMNMMKKMQAPETITITLALEDPLVRKVGNAVALDSVVASA